MSHFDRRLPVLHDADQGDDLPSCSPSIYVSNEEAALLAAMRKLGEAAAEIKREMRNADSDHRHQLEVRLEALRAERKGLAEQREAAFVRKMIMLGHLPPDYPIDR